MRCVSYTRAIPWRSLENVLSIPEQNAKIDEFIKKHPECKTIDYSKVVVTYLDIER